MLRYAYRISGAVGEPESELMSTNWLQKEARVAAAARIHCRD
jgi:hypothetical protein